MIEWKERAHEFDDIATLQDPQAREALRNCVSLKYFKLQNMWKEFLLLEYLTRLWDNDKKAFRIGPHMLEIDMDDMYFLIGLLRRGAPILLSRHQSTP